MSKEETDCKQVDNRAVLNLISLLHQWVSGDPVEINGTLYFFPHGTKAIRQLLEDHL